MILYNSVDMNAAADAMWKWEQTGRADESLREEANKRVAAYCEVHRMPDWMVGLLLDTVQVTVRIANGFPPDNGVRR
jgi:hypothetical protein